MANIKCFLIEKTDRFSPFDERGISMPIYKRVDTGEELTDLPAGAMMYMDDPQCPYVRNGPDGKTLAIICPKQNWWYPDERASNCTRMDDDVHRCWVRHGVPPMITIDKNGDTCSAGAGSILFGKPGDDHYWHGYLINGELVEA